MSTAVATLTEQVTCTDAACLNALSDESLCDCSTCFGAGHGHAHKATRQAARDHITTRAKTDATLGASRISRRDDAADAAMGAVTTQRREIPWCTGCMNAADDCECGAA